MIRPAAPGDAAAVAEIWRDGWRDAHLGHVPDELVRVRTDDSFRTRAAARVSDTTVAEVDGEIAGFVMVDDGEIEQVYVSSAHRGRGVADELLREAERQVRANMSGRGSRSPAATRELGRSTRSWAGATRAASTTRPRSRTARR